MEKPLNVNSPLGTRVSVDKICRDCELEISVILLTMDLSVIDMSEFKVILRMDWLTTNRGIIDCDRKELPPAHMMVLVLYFRGDKHDVLPQAVYDFRWHGKLMGWLASLTLEDKVRQGLSIPRVVCEYKDFFRTSYRDYLCRGL